MSESKIVRLDFGNLEKFAKAINAKMEVRVGIFGNKNARKDETGDNKGQTNAEIGFQHEFGTNKIPKRSFLRSPIFQHSEDILKMVVKSGALKKLGTGKPVEFFTDLGIACESIVIEAFNSAGWGEWPANSPATIKRKKGSQPLIDTGQLRRSIASEVVAS